MMNAFLTSLIIWSLALVWLGGAMVGNAMYEPAYARELFAGGFAVTALGAGFLGIVYASLTHLIRMFGDETRP